MSTTLTSKRLAQISGNTITDGSGNELRILVDAAGHIQIDVIGGATAANQALILAQLQDWDYTIGADYLANIPFGTPDGVNYFEFNVNANGDLAINITDAVSGLQATVLAAVSDIAPDLDGLNLLGVHSLLSARLNATTTVGLGAIQYSYEGVLYYGLPTSTALHARDGAGVQRRIGMSGATSRDLNVRIGSNLDATVVYADVMGDSYINIDTENPLVVVGVIHGEDLDVGAGNSEPIKIRTDDGSLPFNEKHLVTIGFTYGFDGSNQRAIYSPAAISNISPDLDQTNLLGTHALISYRKDNSTTEGATRGIYAVSLERENAGASLDFIIIDLSDTVNFPHNTASDDIHITSWDINLNPDDSFAGDIEIGFLENVDATNGDFHPFKTWHMDKRADPIEDFHNWNFDPLICDDTYTLVTNISLNDVAWQTDVPLPSPIGAIFSGTGDLVLRITRTAGSIDFNVLIKYYVT